ncbi:MAG TPA: glycoside hydrolase family 9 protein, partial [Actinomycetota bacterium]
GGRVDVEGGWFDAGDYVKFTGTTSFAVTLMLVAVRDHPSLFAGGGGPDFLTEAERGVRWLLKMVDVPRRSLYYQVGIGSGGAGILADHDVWRLPQKDDGWTQHARRYLAHRPVLRVAPPGAKVPPSLAGRLASAFGLCAQLWAGTPLADRCLHEGQVVFSMAKTKHVGTQITSSPVGYYREDEWRDDLEMGATQLYLGLSQPGAPAPELPASTPRYFLKRAARWADGYMGSPLNGGDTFNLYDIAGLAHAELHGAIEADGGAGLKVSPSGLLGDLRDQMDPRSRKAGGNPFAFGAYPWDPVPHSFGLISEGLLYDEISGTTRYANLARAQADWTLGANAWGSSFVVGAGTTFPFCMQHQIANLAGSTDGSTPILAGATVDGPADYIPGAGFFGDAVACPPGGANPFAPFNLANWRYIDRVQSWSTVEPSLDYTAMSFFAFVLLADG